MKDFKGVGKWNNARIVVNNGNVQHWLNHVKIVELTGLVNPSRLWLKK